MLVKRARGTTDRSSSSVPQSSSSAAQSRAAGLLVTPFFLLFALVTLAPIGYAIYLSLFAQRSSGLGFGGAKTVWAGLNNYRKVLTDPTYLSSYLHTIIYGAIAVPVLLILSMAVALLLDTAYARAKRVLQLGLFTPHLVPGVIAALIWAYLYTPQVSPVIQFLSNWHVHLNLLGASFTYPSLVNITLWEGLGYNMVIYYAGLQAVPGELLEAARIDGASEWRTAWSIKVPLLRESVGLTAIFALIGALQLFAEPLLMSTMGSSSITNNWTPNLYAYTAAFTQNGTYGVAAAASLVLALLAGLLSFLVTRFAKPWQEES